MDKNVVFVKKASVERAVKALTENGYTAKYVDTAAEAREMVLSIIERGSVVSHGGSMTLEECGITAALGDGSYGYLDRSAAAGDPDKTREIYINSLSADYYLGSSNAITEEGELLNVDGIGNRVAAYVFGPKQVIIVAGINKLVPTISEAYERVRRVAAPANAYRLARKTPCAAAGVCMDCNSPERICCDYVVQGKQREKGRITVILVGEYLGY